MRLNFVCTVTCEDDGRGIITDTDNVTVFVVDKDEYTCSIRCPYCERMLYGLIDEDMAKYLSQKGVRVLSWQEGKAVKIEYK